MCNGFSLIGTLGEDDPRLPTYREQIKERGFDDTEIWNLDLTIAKFILPRLVRFKEYTGTYPNGFTIDSWRDELQVMIDAFKILNDDECMELEDGAIDAINKGLQSFAANFRHLWD